jgi:hypothetical protein
MICQKQDAEIRLQFSASCGGEFPGFRFLLSILSHRRQFHLSDPLENYRRV